MYVQYCTVKLDEVLQEYGTRATSASPTTVWHPPRTCSLPNFLFLNFPFLESFKWPRIRRSISTRTRIPAFLLLDRMFLEDPLSAQNRCISFHFPGLTHFPWLGFSVVPCWDQFQWEIIQLAGSGVTERIPGDLHNFLSSSDHLFS